MVADYLHICLCEKESQKEIRPGKIRTSVAFDRARALNMVFVTTHISTALIAHGNLSAASACERTALRFAKQQGAIAMQSNGVRQVRPARAACGFVSTDLGLLAGGEVWRAPGPPAPPTIIFSRKFEYPPLPLTA